MSSQTFTLDVYRQVVAQDLTSGVMVPSFQIGADTTLAVKQTNSQEFPINCTRGMLAVFRLTAHVQTIMDTTKEVTRT